MAQKCMWHGNALRCSILDLLGHMGSHGSVPSINGCAVGKTEMSDEFGWVWYVLSCHIFEILGVFLHHLDIGVVMSASIFELIEAKKSKTEPGGLGSGQMKANIWSLIFQWGGGGVWREMI